MYLYVHTHIHTYIYIYIYTYTHIQTYTCTHIHTHIHTHAHIHIHIYNRQPQTHPNTAAAVPLRTLNMQLLAGYLQLKLILKSFQNTKSNSNIYNQNLESVFFTKSTKSSLVAKFACFAYLN